MDATCQLPERLASGVQYEDDIPMGPVAPPPDCASRAYPYLTAPGTGWGRRDAPFILEEGLLPEEVYFPDPGDIPEDLPAEGPCDFPAFDEDNQQELPKGKRNKLLGVRGEEAACRFLSQRGYFILERNWTCFAGEADIICLCDDDLVFVEVKTRRNQDKGFPAEAVNRKKRERYERIALCYLKDSDLVDVNIRFDIISIVIVDRGRAAVRHHIGAFQHS